MLGEVLELDHLCFGGLWTLEAYQRELNSPNSVLLGLSPSLASPTHPSPLAPLFEKPLARLRPSPLLAMGCLWAILDEAHITILAVHPHYQRQGLGQAVLLALLQVAADRGLERATLEVRASNQPALSLYQKFGFKIAGRRRRYYKDTNEDALILWRGNLQHPDFYNTLPTWQKSVSDRLSLAGWKLNYL